MSTELIAIGIQVIIIGASYCVGRYLLPRINIETIDSVRGKIEVLTKYADSLVVWARKFMDGSRGAEKMAAVVGQLRTIAQRYGIETTDQELTAIAQAAYESMQAGFTDAIAANLNSEITDAYTKLTNAASALIKASENMVTAHNITEIKTDEDTSEPTEEETTEGERPVEID